MMTNTLIEKAMTAAHEERDKRPSRSQYSPEENTRWVILDESQIQKISNEREKKKKENRFYY
jgi:hypothetical protein